MFNSISTGRIKEFCNYEDIDKDFTTLIENLLFRTAERKGCKILSEKTPSNALYFDTLLKLSKNYKVVFVVRDPRAVVSSLLEVGKRLKEKNSKLPPGTKDIWDAIGLINEYFHKGFSACEEFSNRSLILKYEELVQEPKLKTQEICDFLNIKWHDNMMMPKQTSYDGKPDDIWYDKKSLDRNIQTTELGKWKNKLTPLEQAIITIVYKGTPNLQKLKYDFNTESFEIKTLQNAVSILKQIMN